MEALVSHIKFNKLDIMQLCVQLSLKTSHS